MSQRQYRKAQARLHRPGRRPLTRKELGRAASLTWFVLLTKPQREEHAEEALKRRGFTAFSPQEWRWRKAHRFAKQKGLVKHDVPAYPKYVFLGIDPINNRCTACGAGQGGSCRDRHGRAIDGFHAERHGLPWDQIEDITFIRGFIAEPVTYRPIRLDGGDIAKVMRASQTPLFEKKQDAEPAFAEVVFAAGEQVRITEGPLFGVPLLFERREGAEAVVRCVDGAGREMRVPYPILGRAA